MTRHCGRRRTTNLLQPLLVVAWAACNEPVPCTDEACAARCEETTTAPTDPTLLTPIEQKILGDRLRDLSVGVRTYGPQGFGLCAGANTCERWLGGGSTEPLPPGSYVVHAEVQVPADGTWVASTRVVCRAVDRNDDGTYTVLLERQRDIPVRPSTDGGPVVLDAIERLISPFPLGDAACDITLHGGIASRHPERFTVRLPGVK
jgi:hypothetical protein